MALTPQIADSIKNEPDLEKKSKMALDAGVDPQLVRGATKQAPKSFRDALEGQIITDQPTTARDEMVELSPSAQYAWNRGTGSEEGDRYVGARLAAVDVVQNGGDIYDKTDRKIDEVSQSPDIHADVQGQLGELANNTAKKVLAKVSEIPGADNNVLQAVYDDVSSWRMRVNQPHGFEAITEDMLNSLVAIKTQKGNSLGQEMIFRNYASASLAQTIGQTSTVDKIWDFTRLFAGVTTTVALSDFTEKFDGDTLGNVENFLGETVGRIPHMNATGKGYDAYVKTVDQFWKLPVEQRVLVYENIKNHIYDITGARRKAGSNQYAFAALMQPFVDRASIKDVGFDYAADTATLGLFALGKAGKVVGFMRTIRNARKPITTLKESGNLKLAADLINKALKDSDTARARKITGMEADEVAHSANALDVSEVVPGQIHGVAAEAAKQVEDEILTRIADVQKAYADVMDPSKTPQRFYFDEAALRARQREILGELNDYPNFARITETHPDGFTVEVESGSKYAGTYDADTLRAANEVHARTAEDAKESLQQQRDWLSRNLQYGETRVRGTKKLDEATDAAWMADPDSNNLRKQLSAINDQIKHNERIIKSLEKPPKVEKSTIKYTFDQFGRQNVEEYGGGVTPILHSPSQVVDQLFEGQVGDATLAVLQEEGIAHALSTAARDAKRGLTPKELKDVDSILKYGDELEREFTPYELMTGIDTKWGHARLDSKNSIASYYAQREAYEMARKVKSTTIAANLERGDYRQLRLKILDENGDPIHMYAKPSGERGKVPDNVKRIYDHKTGDIVDVHGIEDLESRLNGEWSVTQFRHGRKFGDEVVNYGIIRKERDLKPIHPANVLPRRAGYVPKIRPGITHVVTRRVNMMVDGNKADKYFVERFFRSQSEAYEWKAAQKDFENLEVYVDQKYREAIDPHFDEEFDMLNFGGLYGGERTDRRIMMGLDGKEANRYSAYKGLQMYNNHIANRYSSNELKMAMVGRFENTYGKYLIPGGDWRRPVNAKAASDTRLKKSIEAQREFINSVMRVPNHFQQKWAGWMHALGDAMEGKPALGGKLRDFVFDIGTRDPTAAIRAVTFHQFLGMFNPSQILVQGFGIATAAFAYPHLAPKLLLQNLGIRATHMFRNSPQYIDLVEGFTALERNSLKTIHSEITRLGLFDSLKTSADYNATAQGVSMTADAFKRMSDSGLIFIREMEMQVRSYGYLLARHQFLKGKPSWYVPTAKDIDIIGKDSTKYTLNLMRANGASWQKGLASIPLQFWQVTAKFYENMLGGSFDNSILRHVPGVNKVTGKTLNHGIGKRVWTPGEKLRISIGHMAAFGFAGVPFFGPATDSVVAGAVNWYKGLSDNKDITDTHALNPTSMDDATFARIMRGGITQVLAHRITGADPDIVNRISVPAGAADSISMYKQGDSSVMRMLGGATFSGQLRVLDAAKGLGDIFGVGWDNLSITDEEKRQAIMEVAGIFSTTRNVSKAYWWHKMGEITNSKGKVLFPATSEDEFNSIVLWQGLGFAPAKINWLYGLDKSTADLKAETTEIVDATVTMLNRYQAPDEFNTEAKRHNIAAKWLALTAGLTPAQRDHAYDLVQKRLNENKVPKLIDSLADAVKAETEAGGKVTPGTPFNPLLVPKN